MEHTTTKQHEGCDCNDCLLREAFERSQERVKKVTAERDKLAKAVRGYILLGYYETPEPADALTQDVHEGRGNNAVDLANLLDEHVRQNSPCPCKVFAADPMSVGSDCGGHVRRTCPIHKD